MYETLDTKIEQPRDRADLSPSSVSVLERSNGYGRYVVCQTPLGSFEFALTHDADGRMVAHVDTNDDSDPLVRAIESAGYRTM